MKLKQWVAFALLLSIAAPSHAGFFSRSRTEAGRAEVAEGGVAKPVQVDGLVVYSFLQDGAGADNRMSRGIERFRRALHEQLEHRGARVSSIHTLAAGAKLPSSTTVRHVAGPVETGSITNLSEVGKWRALEKARSQREAEAALPATHRLILLPQRMARSTGLSWTWAGGVSTGVPHAAYQVYWLLEDISGHAAVVGKTTGTLDVRGFPANSMAEQIGEELDRLDVHLSGQ